MTDKMSGVRFGRVLQFVVAGGAALWVAGLFLWPGLLFPAGTFICHQRPERSFFVHGQQMPVCARCTGLYVGAALVAPFAMALAAPSSSRRARWILGVAALPTLVTWTLEFAGLVPFSNVARLLAALPLGIAAAWLVLAVLSDQRDGHR